MYQFHLFSADLPGVSYNIADPRSTKFDNSIAWVFDNITLIAITAKIHFLISITFCFVNCVIQAVADSPDGQFGLGTGPKILQGVQYHDSKIQNTEQI